MLTLVCQKIGNKLTFSCEICSKTVYNRVDLCVTIHKPILLGGLVLFNDKNKNYEKIRKNTNAPLKFEIRIRIFLPCAAVDNVPAKVPPETAT